MDQEINNVLVWYNNSLNKLTSIRNYYYNLINRMGVRHNIKIYYKNYITTWYNYERSKLTKRKENMIEK